MDVRNNISFTSRSFQIRDAQWVAHTVNTEFPHFSLTKMQPMCAKFLQKNNYCKNLPKSFGEIDEVISYIPEVSYYQRASSFLERLLFSLELSKKPPEEQKNIKMAISIKENIKKLWDFRMGYNESYSDDKSYLNNLISQVKKMKMGNCFEDAVLSEFVLKLNGFGSATSACLFKKDKLGHVSAIDHVVCAFSPDVNDIQACIPSNPSNDIIILDSWLGIVDYAINALQKYKTIGSKFFHIGKDDTIVIRTKNNLDLTKEELAEFRKMYPQLIFKNKNRNFMQQNKKP